MIEVVPATPEHAKQMAPRLRAEDRREVTAFGFAPLDALLFSLGTSVLAESAVRDGKVLAMWGACAESFTGNKAVLWMLGTDDVPCNPKALLRGSRSFVEHVQQRYALLECYVDTRYTSALRWVAWLGFNTVAEVPVNGIAFAVCRREG